MFTIGLDGFIHYSVMCGYYGLFWECWLANPDSHARKYEIYKCISNNNYASIVNISYFMQVCIWKGPNIDIMLLDFR